MGGNGGCGCGAVGAEPCRCERPVGPPDGVPPANGAPPTPPHRVVPPSRPRGPVAAPGTPQPYTRFDLFEETRRRGFPVAFPDDPARPPPPPGRAEAERLRALAEGGPLVLEPSAHPAAEGRPVLEPRFDAPTRRSPADGPLAPEGTPLDVEMFFDVATPEGVAVPFATAWPGDIPPPERPTGRRLPAREGMVEGAPIDALARARARPGDSLQPPEYLGSMGGAAERRLLEAPPADESRIIELPTAPDPPGFASPQEPQGKEPRAPGQAPCTTDAFYVFPPVEEFLFTPQPPEARGKGGAAEPETSDPCPCVCTCVHHSNIVNVFVEAGRLKGPLFELHGKDTSTLLGVSAKATVVIATPDGFVEHVRDVVTRRDAVRYGTPYSAAPGSVAPADGLSATFAARTVAAPTFVPRLLWPELDGTVAAQTRVAAPVGPGPGLPGIGGRPLVPASGSPLRAAPGSLPAGIAPAGDGFGADLRGRAP